MKKLVLIVCLFAFSVMQAQEVKPKYEAVGDKVKATYYYADGSIHKQGFFKNEKLTGKWTEFDQKGNTVMIAYYKKGKKTGKWLQWKEGKFRQISYDNNKIVSVGKWTADASRLASN
jgi:antitoxin component YwqK of YwqJK toxin-antitoxin module